MSVEQSTLVLMRGQHALLNDEENIIDVNIADEREEIDLQSPHIALQSGASHRHHPPPTGHKSSHNTTASTSSASAGGYTTISPSLSPMPPSSSNTTNVVLANTSSDTNDTYTGSRTTINDNNNSSNRQRSGQTFYLRHSNESLIFSLDQDEEDHRVGLNVRTIISAVLLCVGGLIMTITGAVYYWESSFHDGLGIFVVGLVMLMPGSYGMTIVVGYCLRWPGYEADRLPLL